MFSNNSVIFILLDKVLIKIKPTTFNMHLYFIEMLYIYIYNIVLKSKIHDNLYYDFMNSSQSYIYIISISIILRTNLN